MKKGAGKGEAEGRGMRTKRNEGGLQKLSGFRGLSIISGQIITEISGNNIVCQLGLNMHVYVVEKKD